MSSERIDSDNDESDEELSRSRSIKLKQNKTRLILSDDEDEETTPMLSDLGNSQSDGEEVKEGDAELENHMKHDQERQTMFTYDNSNDNMGMINNKPNGRKKIRRPVDSSDDDDEDTLSNNLRKNDKPTERRKIQRPIESSDDEEDVSNDKDRNDRPKEKKSSRPAESSDDGEDGSSLSDEDDDNDPKQKKKGRRVFGSSDSSDDSSGEEEEEGEIAFQLAASPKDPEAENDGNKRSMRRKRISKEHLQEIHSETQRIVRESSIRLPYHHPKPLSLDELFSKKPSQTTLKSIGTRVPRIPGKQLLDTSIVQADSRKEDKTEGDELPDVLSLQTIASPTTDISCENNLETSKDTETEVESSKVEADIVDMVGGSNSLDGTIETDDRVKSAQNEDDNKTEQATTSPSLSKENDVSTTKTIQDPPAESPPLLGTSQKDSNEAQIPVFKTPTSAGPDPQSSQSRRMQRLQDSLNRLKGVQPKLSGGPKITIDLDEGSEPSAEEKGVAKLMKRFVKHTKHVKKIHQKDVKINVVTKETGEDGKEDLKHHTFTVGLDSKPEAMELSTNIPGAKLGLLKENLQATMKVKREQERLKRREVFKLDNEEGFEDEDEAELTEGSDTEEEEGEEEGEKEKRRLIGDEDDDEDYEPGNEYIDDEAESDDDDDDDEVEDEMQDEDEEEITPIKKLKKKSLSDKSCELIDSDDEITPSRRKGSTKRAMVVDDVEDADNVEKGITLRLDSTETDDTDTEMSDAMQDSGRFVLGSLVRTPRSVSALDQCSKTMEMFDSATNSSEFQVPISRTESGSKKVSWSATKDTDSSKDSIGFVLPAPVRQDSSSNSMDTSFEAMTSLIPAHQPEGGMRRSGRASVDSTKGESFTPFSKHQSVLSNISAKTVSRNELSLPVEDSQDLFHEDSPRLPIIADSQQVSESQSFHFSFEETQTQFLDENGLLNLKPSSSSTKKKTMFGGTQTHNAESQSSMEELLGLCSGQFTATQAGVDDMKDEKPGPFSQVSQRPGTQANMDELLNLCSGTFTEMGSKSQISSTRIIDDHKDEKDDDDHSFHIASDPDGPDSDDDDNKGFSDEDIAPKKRRRIIQQESDEDDEDEEDGEEEKGQEESDLDSEFDFGVNREKFKGKTYGKKLNLANFVEDEAELSGSEFDSDENYDAEDEPDDEDLEGIVNEETANQDELRDQVNKVHLKTMDDDDARRLRIFKEMYLPDGDLHSDNKGRERRFRWRHMESQMDMFRPGSDGEEDEDDAEDQDTQWRLQRYQREQWLKENQDKGAAVTSEAVTPPVDENSQFAKCLRAATIKKSQEPPAQDVAEKEKEKDKGIAITKPLKIMSSRGSFLSRSKTDLAKMASMLKPVNNPQAPRNNKNFVFHSAEPSVSDDNMKEPPKVKRSASVSGPSRTPSGPQAKRPRLERSQSQFTSGSVFRHF